MKGDIQMDKIKLLGHHFTEHAAMYHGDTVEVIRGIPDNSVGMILTSIPFSDQYTYSSSDHDLGNNLGDAGFFDHLDWAIPEWLRVTVPGRICAVHVKDRLRYKNRSGSGGLNPFSDMVTSAMLKHGWNFHARITIATDPVRELQQTKRQGLRYMDIKEDASMCGPGIPEYLMLYRKWEGLPDDRSFSAVRVPHDANEYTLRRWQLEANAIWQSDGTVLEGARYDHEARVAAIEDGHDITAAGDVVPYMGGRYAGPKITKSPPWIWLDVDRMDTLNYQLAKEGKDEKHICPLQLDLIKRAIRLWTTHGDVVLDPFAGIGSVPYTAVEMGRCGVGIELKDSYFKWACKYIEDAERVAKNETLFTEVITAS
jgi:DNA modification methylase